jgi:hypothetical protein
MLVQHPPLHPVLAPPQSDWHEWIASEQAVIEAQSVAALQPQSPATHALLVPCVAQSLHAPPFVPHAAAAVPVTQVPFAQQPPLHAWVAEHAVVHVPPLHAYPGGQSDVNVHVVVHWPLWHVMPPEHAWADPQPPQLFGSFAKLAQTPLHSVKPGSHVKVHAPPTQPGCALATLVEQVRPQAPQLFVSVCASTQAPPQRVLAAAGQPDAHEYAPPSVPAAQTGVPPSVAQTVPHAPQLAAVVRATQAPLQRVVPAEQMNVQ